MAVDVRTLLAALLGVGLGALMLAAPELVVRVHTVGRVPGDRRGEYGTDASGSDRLRLAVRVLGGFVLLAGGYFGAQVAGLV